MRVTQLLGTAALLFTSSIAPAQAGSLTATQAPGSSVAIRPADFPSDWERFLDEIRPVPTASNLIASAGRVTTGQASWYGPGFFGNRTASGEVLRPGTLTAAHRTLPFGTMVRVTNLWNGRSAVVRINDRGPFHGRRVIDLAHGAAQELGLTASGIADVKLEVLP
ncbi:septal ring lytic transglycosylase RlpA family protein [Cyanobium sp. Lug-B]|mgnify:FL=1|jgi:rare lipoprotein A|uniref:Probable endolytic peptidoglycan transglycosylase RlpA n=1 Tax=Aphanothece cf. minutissima CCALA 015 TaxID=2107695 RepID=A0ABX5F6C0_9CHRO|nr:septal ring lytic transglycosylase RlpA family protein [Cyanobium sp. Lug-B]MCP9797882.1 septal ring lytic transglycosylase RlpA family protein [Cyanobium sp. Lug-B]PSB37062.1 septal ring lytic transglycosylase RlpA family lipoprotein [Aphanothece cf. minutissima CCALA 015]